MKDRLDISRARKLSKPFNFIYSDIGENHLTVHSSIIKLNYYTELYRTNLLVMYSHAP